jgi:hypothetical protein
MPILRLDFSINIQHKQISKKSAPAANSSSKVMKNGM